MPSRHELERQANYLASRLEHTIEQLSLLELRPEDDFEEGAVIWFEKTFRDHPGARVYTYAAVKANGLWYSTGPLAPKGYTWDGLLDWMQQEGSVQEIWYATEFELLAVDD